MRLMIQASKACSGLESGAGTSWNTGNALAGAIDSIEHQAVQMDVEIGGRAKSLDQRDTTGMATPPIVVRSVEAIRRRFPDLEIALHFHNTGGIGLANVLAGLDLGVREYESSIGGIGGCPFAPGATGNICTEDLVYLLHECGFETGIDLEKLARVARRVEGVVEHSLPGQVMKAGPRLKLHSIASVKPAVG